MNKPIIIIFILLLIVISSGCTYKDNSPPKLKKYKGNGIFFYYPPEYDIKETGNKTGVILTGKSGIDPNYKLEISKEYLDKEGEVNGMSLEEMKNTERLKKSGFTVEAVETIKIRGFNAIDIIYARYVPPYVKYECIVFENGNKRYKLLFINNDVGVTDTRATMAISNSIMVI